MRSAGSGSLIHSSGAAEWEEFVMGWTKRGVQRIPKLTPGQEHQIPVFAEKWNKIATSIEPWDSERAAAGIRRFLKVMGCRQPKRRVWKYGSLRHALEEGGFTAEEAQAKNPRIFKLRHNEPGLSLQCFLIRTFEPSIVSTVVNFMQRNIAQAVQLGYVAQFLDMPER